MDVTLSNAGHARKCVGKFYTFSMAILLDRSQRGCLRPLTDILKLLSRLFHQVIRYSGVCGNTAAI